VATVQIVPGKTDIQVSANGKAVRVPPALLEVPGGLYPLKSAAFEVDEYRIMSGWPVSIPTGDIRIHCQVTGDGTVLGNRMEPTALTTNADMRWVADADFYDQTALLWRPLQSGASPWETSAESAPSLIADYEYRVGDERFMGMSALNFDSDTNDYMWIDLSLALGGTTGYTVIMVMSPNSVYGNDTSVHDNTLWGPDSTLGAWSVFTVKEKAIWLTTEEQVAQKGVAIGNALTTAAPSYVALVVGRPQTTLYAGPGPTGAQVKALTAGAAPEPLSPRFRLGFGPFPSSATMDMALLDLSIYANLLSKEEVLAEFALLSQVYGGDG
jgi:hypothetical protein